MTEREERVDFENLAVDDLAQLLRSFYGEVCQRNGEPYSKSALVNTRAGLNRYLTSPPHSRQINLMKDKVFQGANQVIGGVMKQMRRDGLDTTKHKDAIPEEDMHKLYDSRTLSNDNAKSLLHKVFF